jgi:glutathione S-transferase
MSVLEIRPITANMSAAEAQREYENLLHARLSPLEAYMVQQTLRTGVTPTVADAKAVIARSRADVADLNITDAELTEIYALGITPEHCRLSVAQLCRQARERHELV